MDPGKDKYIKRVVDNFRKRYPAGKVIYYPGINDPMEVVCERLLGRDDYSEAEVIFYHSQKHRHKKTTEVYIVTGGTLWLHIEGLEEIDISLHEGERYIISPWQYHWAEGYGTRVLVRSTPPYDPRDHFLVYRFLDRE